MLLRTFTFVLFGLMDAAGSAAGSGGGAGAGAGSSGGAGTGSGSSAGTGASAAPGGGSGAPPTGASGTGQQPPSGQGTGTGTGQPGDIADGNWRELRSRYDQRGQELQQAQAQVQAFTQLRTTAADTARQLGYDQADFEAAFQQDPAATIAVLRQQATEAAQRGGNRQNQQPFDQNAIRDMIRRETAPVNEMVNRQITEAAMTRYTTTVGDAIKADPVLKDAPPEVTSIVEDYLGEYFATQPEILNAMKTKGDFSAVGDAVKFIAGRMHSAFQAWAKKGGQPPAGQGTGQQPGPNTGRRPTLDEMIDNPGLINPRYNS